MKLETWLKKQKQEYVRFDDYLKFVIDCPSIDSKHKGMILEETGKALQEHPDLIWLSVDLLLQTDVKMMAEHLCETKGE